MTPTPTRTAGVHLDHGRKHFGGAWIERLLHRMAALGLDELQLHVSENEGFRLPSTRHPELVSAEHLRRDELARVLAVAADHGIRVVPSLDVPGHMRHVLLAHPELALRDARGAVVPDAIDLDLPRARALVAGLHDDLAELFPDAEVWHAGFDEIVPVDDARAAGVLAERARASIDAAATEHDLTTLWANGVVDALARRGVRTRLWNDALLRASVVQLDARAEIAWWTGWHPDMAPVERAIARGHRIVDCNDAVLYHVLGEAAGYAYPTVDRLRAIGWRPGVLPSRADGTRQVLAVDEPLVTGSLFCIWSDVPDAQTPDEVLAAIDAPLAEYARRATAR